MEFFNTPNDPNTQKVRKAAAVCLAVNLALTFFKFVCGFFGRSQVIMADAAHTLSDTITDITVFAGAGYWSKPPDKEHPYGHRRIETLVTIFIAGSLFAVGLGLAYNGLASLLEGTVRKTGWIAFAAAVVSLLTKEILFRWSLAIGRKTGSKALIANAQHQRSDALSSIPAAVAVALSAFSPKLWFIDDIGAVVIACFIMNIARQIGWPALKELVDTGAPKKDIDRIKALSLAIAGVKEVHAVRTRYTGAGLQTDLHVLVDPELTVRDGHRISERVKQLLLSKGPGVLDAVIHIEPYETKKSGKDR